MSIKHDEIHILDDREQARDKVAIWFGSRDNYYHPVKEIIANSCDEIINNFEKGKVTVELSSDNKTISISDTGRGIPIDGETDGIKNYDVLFRKLFAGTKYNIDGEVNNDTTTGTNGVGMAVVCMTSEYFEVNTCYNSKKYNISFSDGGKDDSGLKTTTINKGTHGTEITFKLDPKVYTDTVLDEKVVYEIINSFAIASANKNIDFKFIYKGKEKEIKYESLVDYFEGKVGNKTTSKILHSPNETILKNEEMTNVELLITTQPENFHETFLNLTYLSEGGSIHNGVVYGIREYCSDYCKENKLFKGKVDRFLPSDIENSVSFVANVFSNNVEYNNQTKLSTGKQLYRDIVLQQTKFLLDHFKNTDKKGFDKFIKHLLTVQQHNAKNQRATRQLRDKLTKKIEPINNRVDKLVDCKEHGENSEIFIAEGDSAKGSIIASRNPLFQATYPLKGKILNCIDNSESRILKNETITDLIKILGCGIKSSNKNLNSFDINKLRYGKVIIATDQDEDGHHIASLILAMIYRLMPKLLTGGYVYIAQTPLYEILFKDDSVMYIKSEQEMDKTLDKIKGKSYTISRAKGLGELDAQVLGETTMNPDTRRLLQVKVDDLDEFGKYLEKWFGKDVTGRKEHISKHLDKYIKEE